MLLVVDSLAGGRYSLRLMQSAHAGIAILVPKINFDAIFNTKRGTISV